MLNRIFSLMKGKKTYTVGIAGILFSLMSKFGWLPEGLTEAEMTDFINTLLAFGGLIFLRMGAKTEAESVKKDG